MTTLYSYHNDFLLHDTGSGHPESAARLTSINQVISKIDSDRLVSIKPDLRPDVAELILLVHDLALVNYINQHLPQHGYFHIDPDTILSPDSINAALLAVSAVCQAVDQVQNGLADNAFCALRPPGHHAKPGKSMGFCLFNNIAIAARYALKKWNLERIAIVDFDVHHGNGTQAVFYQTKEVFYASSHEMPLYPGTGYSEQTGVGNIVNVPLTPATSGEQFREKYKKIILPKLRQFNPELILLSAGFDAHKADPLSTIRLEADDYAWLTTEVRIIAKDCCNGRIISALEGGYNLAALAESVTAHIHSLYS